MEFSTAFILVALFIIVALLLLIFLTPIIAPIVGMITYLFQRREKCAQNEIPDEQLAETVLRADLPQNNGVFRHTFPDIPPSV